MQSIGMKITAGIVVALIGSGLLSAVSIGAMEIAAATQRPAEYLRVEPADHSPAKRYQHQPAHNRVVVEAGRIHTYRKDAKDMVELIRQDVAIHGGRTTTKTTKGPVTIVAPSGYIERIRPILDQGHLGSEPAYIAWANSEALRRQPEAARGELTRMTVHIMPNTMPNPALQDAQIIAIICAVVLPIIGLFVGIGLVGWMEEAERGQQRERPATA